MADVLTKAQRSYCMSRIRGKDTLIERQVRSALHKQGLRFSKHSSDIPGKPDVVFRSLKVAIFVDGDFWHGRNFSKVGPKLSPFWREKIGANLKRDNRNRAKLRRMGWKVLRIWEGSMKRRPDPLLSRVTTVIERRKDELSSKKLLAD